MSNNIPKTPCVGLCSTVYGDTVCRGCKRFDYEIIDWNGYSEAQKQRIWQRLEQIIEQILIDKLMITDATLLKQKLIQYKIRFRPEQSAYYWAYLLLIKGSRLIKNIQAYGIELKTPYEAIPLWQLREQIDQEFFTLSESQYILSQNKGS